MDYYLITKTFYQYLQSNNTEAACIYIENIINALPQQQITAEILELVKMLNSIMQYKNDSNQLLIRDSFKTAFYDLEKKYHYACIDFEPGEFKENRSDEIWWCWLQGFDEAPAIVKSCYRSLEKLGRKINIITLDNYMEYISLPEYIIEKYNAGIIGQAHFSDILRIALLDSFGGTWIDSTVFATGTEMYQMISEKDLFLYKNLLRGEESEYSYLSNWLIHASKPSQILGLTRHLIFEYWKNENIAIHYYMMHIFLTIACKIYPDELENIPTYSNVPCHIMQTELAKHCSDDRFLQLKKMSDFHKLTYRLGENMPEDALYYKLIKS